jgi:hypothetical protein
VAQSARQLAMSIACGRVADQGPDAENARGRTMVQGCDRHVGPCIFWKSDVTDPVEKRPARCAGDGHSHDVAAFDGEGAGGGANAGSAGRAAGLRLVRAEGEGWRDSAPFLPKWATGSIPATEVRALS